MYSTRDVVRLCKLTQPQVRQLVRQGWVTPERDARGRFRFDMAMLGRLKRAHQLIQQVPPRRLGAALRSLEGSPDLDHVIVVGGELVVLDEAGMFEARTGQVPMDFDPPEYSQLTALPTPTAIPVNTEQWSAEDWFELACDRDGYDDDGAREAYLKALELDPGFVDAQIGLAGVYEAAGDPFAAIPILRTALQEHSGHAVGWELLGLCYEHIGRDDEALSAYDNAIDADPYVADVRERAALLCDRLGLTLRAAEHRAALTELEDTW